MSPIRLPTTAAAIPAASARSVVATSSRSRGRGVPTGKVVAASPTQPSRVAPASTLSRSPSSSSCGVGMPCSATSLTDRQTTPGNGGVVDSGAYPRNGEEAPASARTARATWSSWVSRTPGAAAARTAASMSATTAPAARIASSSPGVRNSINGPPRVARSAISHGCEPTSGRDRRSRRRVGGSTGELLLEPGPRAGVALPAPLPRRPHPLGQRAGQAAGHGGVECLGGELLGGDDERPVQRRGLAGDLGAAGDRVAGDDRPAVLEAEHQRVQPHAHHHVGSAHQRLDLGRTARVRLVHAALQVQRPGDVVVDVQVGEPPAHAWSPARHRPVTGTRRGKGIPGRGGSPARRPPRGGPVSDTAGDLDLSAIERERTRIRDAHLKPSGERPASTARGLHHTALISSDVERTVRFYQDVLGFPLTELIENRDYPGSSHFFFDIGNGNLLAFFDFPGLDLGPYAEVLGGLHHVAISVDPQRWRELKGRLEAAGVPHEVHSEVSVYFTDPDGARIELIADPLGEMYGSKVL